MKIQMSASVNNLMALQSNGRYSSSLYICSIFVNKERNGIRIMNTSMDIFWSPSGLHIYSLKTTPQCALFLATKLFLGRATVNFSFGTMLVSTEPSHHLLIAIFITLVHPRLLPSDESSPPSTPPLLKPCDHMRNRDHQSINLYILFLHYALQSRGVECRIIISTSWLRASCG